MMTRGPNPPPAVEGEPAGPPVGQCRAVARRFGHSGGLLIGSSSEIVPCTPVENILAFYDTCRTCGTFPLRV